MARQKPLPMSVPAQAPLMHTGFPVFSSVLFPFVFVFLSRTLIGIPFPGAV
jgi:hypothetical protein